MKKKEMKALVSEQVDNGNKDRSAIAIILLQAGATLSKATNIISEVFKEKGITARTSSSALNDAREALKTDIRTTDVKVYKDMREIAEELQEEFDIAEKTAINLVKEQLKKEGLAIPSKVRIGSVKALIIDHFIEMEGDVTLEGLTKFLDESIEGIDEDKLKATASAEYMYAYMMYHHVSVEDVN